MNQTLLHRSYEVDAHFSSRTNVQLWLHLVYFSNSLNTYNSLLIKFPVFPCSLPSFLKKTDVF